MVTLLKVNNAGWRVDVTLSTTTTSSSSARPSVLMTLELSDGTSQILQLDLQSFGQLRCKVAELLAELQLVHDRMQAKILPEIRQMDS
uniref:COMM domain-containing protein 5 n=1 Tax=Picea sitchensis TaxID=3332 RepID=D5AD98_PICSI|nr:unknown [Picea sitchensis]